MDMMPALHIDCCTETVLCFRPVQPSCSWYSHFPGSDQAFLPKNSQNSSNILHWNCNSVCSIHCIGIIISCSFCSSQIIFWKMNNGCYKKVFLKDFISLLSICHSSQFSNVHGRTKLQREKKRKTRPSEIFFLSPFRIVEFMHCWLS